MRMTLEEFRKRFPKGPEPAPLEYAGQWVAWNTDRTTIIAHGPDLGAVYDEAKAAGCESPRMQKVLGTAFIGCQ